MNYPFNELIKNTSSSNWWGSVCHLRTIKIAELHKIIEKIAGLWYINRSYLDLEKDFMQKDLGNLAKEMQKLKSDERLYWLQSMAQCCESQHPTTYPMYKTYNQIGEDFLRFKGIIVRSLSSILTGKSEEAPVIKNGVHVFMSASKEEREEFYKTVLKEVPNKIATKTSRSSSTAAKARTHE